jgi:hypothetical protein
LLFAVLLVAALAAPLLAQNDATTRDRAASLRASSFIDALMETVSRFQLPLAVEWVQSPDTLKPVRLPRNFATPTEAVEVILCSHADYAWRLESGVIHVFEKAMVNDPRNPLNVIVSQVPNRSWTVRDADNFLFQSIGQAVRSTGPKVLSVSSPSGREPQFHLAASNAPVREVLNQIITASKMKIWVATFPGNSPLTVKGFRETTPMYDVKGVKPDDQPFWIFLRWGMFPGSGSKPLIIECPFGASQLELRHAALKAADHYFGMRRNN